MSHDRETADRFIADLRSTGADPDLIDAAIRARGYEAHRRGERIDWSGVRVMGAAGVLATAVLVVVLLLGYAITEAPGGGLFRAGAWVAAAFTVALVAIVVAGRVGGRALDDI